MALTATIHRFVIDLSDVDRGVYESLDLRAARHPSESVRYLLQRTFAYALCYAEGIAFSKGLFVTDEPAVWIRQPDNRIDLWVDIGRPSMERLHKASKHAARVVVFTDDPDHLRREAGSAKVHRAEAIELHTVEATLFEALEQRLDRNMQFTLVHTDGRLYLTLGDKTFEGALTRRTLVDADD